MRDSLRSGPALKHRWPFPFLLIVAMLPAQAARAEDPRAPAEVAPAATPAAVVTPQPPAPAPTGTGLVTIESDSQKADNATGIITAIGNVRILYPDRRLVATSRQAQYFTKEGRIVLTGEVDVIQEGGNLLRAERVVYLVDSERVLAEPVSGQQVFSQLRLQQNPASPGAAKPQ
jgi:lipopolysaccharide export system protein LptA